MKTAATKPTSLSKRLYLVEHEQLNGMANTRRETGAVGLNNKHKLQTCVLGGISELVEDTW